MTVAVLMCSENHAGAAWAKSNRETRAHDTYSGAGLHKVARVRMSGMAGRDRNDRKPQAGPAPTEPILREAALTHLARFGTTRAGLIRVLDRRVDRWAQRVEADPETVSAQVSLGRAAARVVADKLVEAGTVDDAAYAASRARNLARAGRSRLAVKAHLQARGVASELVREAVPDDPDTELAAALAFARRRRIGPFRREEPDQAAALKELGTMARAGYSREVANTALRMDAEEATDRINRARQP